MSRNVISPKVVSVLSPSQLSELLTYAGHLSLVPSSRNLIRFAAEGRTDADAYTGPRPLTPSDLTNCEVAFEQAPHWLQSNMSALLGVFRAEAASPDSHA